MPLSALGAFVIRAVGVFRTGGTGVVAAEDREPRVGGSEPVELELDRHDGGSLGSRSV